MDLAKLLAILAMLVQMAAFLVYNWKMFRGQQSPNTSTWSLWAVLTILNSASYRIASGDFWISLLPIATSAACILTCIFALFKGKFKKLSSAADVAVLIIGLVAAILWKIYESAALGNVILQLAMMVSFIPTFRDVLTADRQENALPWLMWTGAYMINLTVVILRWQHKPWALVYPLVGITFHLVVALLSRVGRNRDKRKG